MFFAVIRNVFSDFDIYTSFVGCVIPWFLCSGIKEISFLFDLTVFVRCNYFWCDFLRNKTTFLSRVSHLVSEWKRNNLPNTHRRRPTQFSFIATVSQLPFATRLSRFPDAWLLPLFPMILRFVHWVLQNAMYIFRFFTFLLTGYRSIRNNVDNSDLANESQTIGRNDHPSFDDGEIAEQSALVISQKKDSNIYYSVRRLILYILIMACRGWILYVGLNTLEDNILLTQSKNDNNHLGAGNYSATSCWYQSYLPVKNQQQSCLGRDFDFSDHVVLYYAQILPIALTETLFSIRYPFWEKKSNFGLIWPIAIGFGQFYLYFITAIGSYKTAAFFHTGGEVFTGFAVSLIISVPLWRLQCSTNNWAASSRLFFWGVS